MTSKCIFSLVYIAYIIALNGSDCSLLENSGSVLTGSYKDTESEDALITMCKQDASSLSSWESYQCDDMKTRDGYQKCWPQRRMSKCNPGELVGVMLFYHGFSACPDAYNTIASQLQEACWHVYQVTTIGHGYTYCGATWDNSTTDKPCTAGKYNETTLPEQRQDYIDYVERINAIFTDEVSLIKECESNDNIQVAVGGLSFGAPLAAASVVLSGNPSIFTKHVIMSPFFGIAYKGLDDILYKCLQNTDDWHDCLPLYFQEIGFNISESAAEGLSDMIDDTVSYFLDTDNIDNSFATFNLLIRKLITWSVEAPERITDKDTLQQVNDALNNVIGWGWKCEMDELPYEEKGLDRGGFCKFSVRKLAAAHSFAQYITQEYVAHHDMDQSVETLAIMVERDGKTGASLSNNYVHLFYEGNDDRINSKSTDCMWLISTECQLESYEGEIDNTCGVPHAFIAEKDNLLIPPYYLYWETDCNGGIINWLNSEDIGNDNFIVKSQWDGTSNQCVYLDLVDYPDALIADTPNLLKLSVVGKVQEKTKDKVLDYVANVTGTPRGILELTYDLREDDDITTLTMFLDENGAQILKTLLDHESISDVGDIPTPNVTVRGHGYVLAAFSDSTTSLSCNDKEKSNAAREFGFMAIGIVIGALLVVAIGCIFIKTKGYQLTPIDDKQYSLMNKNQL